MSRTGSGLILLAMAVLGLGATYYVQQGSAQRIASEQRLIDSHILLDMLPAERYDNQPLEQPLRLGTIALPSSTLQGGYLATRNGQASFVLLRSRFPGYAGSIDGLIAIDSNGKLAGVKILKQSETPGLGARIAEWPNAWLDAFAQSPTEPADTAWALKKDQGEFDQIAGATITSRAVINAIHDALRYFDAHRQELLGNGSHE